MSCHGRELDGVLCWGTTHWPSRAQGPRRGRRRPRHGPCEARDGSYTLGVRRRCARGPAKAGGPVLATGRGTKEEKKERGERGGEGEGRFQKNRSRPLTEAAGAARPRGGVSSARAGPTTHRGRCPANDATAHGRDDTRRRGSRPCAGRRRRSAPRGGARVRVCSSSRVPRSGSRNAP